jgi:uncharacterized SAM-binding protein YcdF (DUF218 family)
MLFVISKILAVLIDPVGLTLVFFAAGAAVAFFTRKTKISASLFICGFATIAAFSSPITAHFLMRGLEGQYVPARAYPPADAVVLLGGFTVGRVPPRIHVETNYSANRAFNAVRVYRQSGSPKMVLTGGVVGLISEDVQPEANTMFELLNEHFGIDSSDVVLERRSRNTRENAVYTKELLEDAGLGTDIILVTSAFHMPRSAAVFKKAGFSAVTPAPAGYFQNSAISRKPLTWMPSSTALFVSSIALREYVGIVSYRIMGWI